MVNTVAISLGKHAFRTMGSGNPMSLCLVMCRIGQNGAGLGDHITSLPVIYDLVDRGYKLTIYTNPFYHPLYEELGVDLHDESEMYRGWTDDNAHKYGCIYSLFEWSLDNEIATGGYPNVDRITLFASFFDNIIPDYKRPEKFDYSFALDVRPEPKEYVVFAPHAVEKEGMYRSFPYDLNIDLLLSSKHTVRWLSNRHNNLTEKFETLRELIDVVASAKAVLAVDNGIMHLAMALGVPCFALFGYTNEHTITEPYTQYTPNGLRAVMRTKPSDDDAHKCIRPCNGHFAKGFHQNNKCMDSADCMAEFDPHQVAAAFDAFMTGLSM
jgi:hypothetical protein